MKTNLNKLPTYYLLVFRYEGATEWDIYPKFFRTQTEALKEMKMLNGICQQVRMLETKYAMESQSLSTGCGRASLSCADLKFNEMWTGE